MKRPNRLSRLLCAASLVAGLAPSLHAQTILDRIPWTMGPVIGLLGNVAEVEVPAYCRFADDKGSKMFLEATENASDGSELGILLCVDAKADSAWWFVVFSFNESGLVKDDEKASLDGNAILKTLQRGNEAGNRERRRRGWTELALDGWERPPYYDSLTHNLTWSTRIREKGANEQSINHSVRLLGRRGVMNADLVADPEQFAPAVAAFDSIIATYTYVDGERYAEWRAGDKVAAFGLTALVAGGAGVAAAKLGFFPKLWKSIIGLLLALKKLLIVVVVGIGAAFKRFFGRKKDADETTPAAAATPKPANRASTTRPNLYAPVKPPSAPPG